MLYLLELALAVFLITLWTTQVILPIIKGEPMFPFFWSKEPKLQVKAVKLNQLIEEEELNNAVEALEAQLNKRKQQHKDTNTDESN